MGTVGERVILGWYPPGWVQRPGHQPYVTIQYSAAQVRAVAPSAWRSRAVEPATDAPAGANARWSARARRVLYAGCEQVGAYGLPIWSAEAPA